MTTTTDTPRGFASEPLWRQAQTYLIRGQLDAVRKVLATLREQGKHLYAHLLTAQIAWREDRVRDAAEEVLHAASIAPDEPETLLAVSNVLMEAGENVVARDCLDRFMLADCRDPMLLMQAATLRKGLQQHAESLAVLDQTESLGSPGAALRYARGVSLVSNGRLDEAEKELVASLTAAPGQGIVAVPLVRLHRQTTEHNQLAAIETGVRMSPPGSANQAAFEFARYKTLEDLGRHDEAWQALARGNALMRARVPDRYRERNAWLERCSKAWPIASPEVTKPVEPPSGPQPIFVIGMPRSGTTVLERMLGNHSQVAVAGELTDFLTQMRWMADTRDVQGDKFMSSLASLDYRELGRRYLERVQWLARGKPFFIDKQPPNWALVAAIRLALPQAPILHMLRDPMDTCFSLWRAYFGDSPPYSYDFTALAETFNGYRRTMAHWHQHLPGAVFDVPYAGLVRNPEATLRGIFDFCGLGWEPGCIDITRNAAPSATPSAAQVRTPLHETAFGEWQPYATQLEPLQRLLQAGTSTTS